jgi:AraC-like DNA-binding protein
LEVLLGRPVRSPVTFDLSLDVARGPGHHWWAVVQALAAQVHDPDSPSPHPLLVASLEHSVTTGLLLAAGHDRRADLDAPVRPACPLAVRRAIDYIENHPELPLTVGDIADVAGVGVRALQEGFRAALDTTPMRYLRDVRLARARQDLLEADGESAGIAEIAYRWGFSHLGRFTAQYRATYREPPSRTLLDR